MTTDKFGLGFGPLFLNQVYIFLTHFICLI